MAKYDFYPDPGGSGYLLNIQSDLLEDLNTQVVVPLLPLQKAPKPAKRLNPVFHIEGADYVMLTQFMSAVPLSIGKEAVGNLKEKFDEITAAIDTLTHGF